MSRNKISQLDHTTKIGHKLTVFLCALLIGAIVIVSTPSLSSTFAQTVQIQPDSTLEHDQIEIGKSVTWTQTVQVPDTVASLAVEIPSDASNISVETSTNNAIDSSRVSASKEPISTENATDQLSLSADKESTPALAPLADTILQGDGKTTTVLVSEPGENIITFETPAPYTVEIEQSTDDTYQKTVTVTHDSALHYTDVLSFSDIPESLVSQGAEFTLYWMVDGVKTDVTSNPAYDIKLVDTDANEIADKMQWTIPQLSEQTFVINGIILATHAQHLDSARNVISNVYDQIKERDAVFTGEIPAADYIRVTFEKPLTNVNDITIFAKSNYADSTVQVYQKDSDVLLATFDGITSDAMYRIFLTSLGGNQDTFDLKVVGNAVDFDYIVDPAVTKTFTFTSGIETWTATTASDGTCSGSSIDASRITSGGNPGQALQITTSSSGIDTACNSYWEWSGTWEDLGVPINTTVTAVKGGYDFATPTASIDSWKSGPFELRDNSGAARGSLLSATSSSSVTSAWKIRSLGTGITFAGEPSNTPIKLRLNNQFTNTASNSFTHQNDNIKVQITFADTTKPVIDFHADMLADATSASGVTVPYTSPDTSDNVDAPGVATCSPASNSLFPIGLTTITCNASDTVGNSAIPTTFEIVVSDGELPVIAAHLNETAEATSASGATVSYTTPTTSDNIDAPGVATCSPTSGSLFTFGSTLVTCNAIDSNGNTAIPTTFKVNVIDTTSPVITLLGLSPVNIQANSPYTDSGATASDNLDGDLTSKIVSNATSISTASLGSFTITYDVTDSQLNTAVQVTRTVNVIDTIIPVGSVSINNGAIYTTNSSSILTLSCTDLGGCTQMRISTDGTLDTETYVAFTTLSPVTLLGPDGTNTIKVQFKDISGNESAQVNDDIILDTISPTVTYVGGPADGASYVFGSVPSAPTCNATDVTSGVNASGCIVTGYGTSVGLHTLNAKAKDNAGNETISTRTYTVTGLTLSGFLRPIDNPPTLNRVDGGDIVGVRFEIFAGDKELTSTSYVQSVQQKQVASSSCPGSVNGVAEPIKTDYGTSLRYNYDKGFFVDRWATPTDKTYLCYDLIVTTIDGNTLVAHFKFR